MSAVAWPSMHAAQIRRLLKRSPSQPPLNWPVACMIVSSATTTPTWCRE